MKRTGFKTKAPLTDAQKQLKDAYRKHKQDLKELAGLKREDSGKHHKIPVWYDGIRFASTLQRNHYKEFKLLIAAKVIKDYDYEIDIPLHVNGIRIGHYRADHIYFDIEANLPVICDSKGKETQLFAWKWKHVQAEYPHFIFETKYKDRTLRTYPRGQPLEMNDDWRSWGNAA